MCADIRTFVNDPNAWTSQFRHTFESALKRLLKSAARQRHHKAEEDRERTLIQDQLKNWNWREDKMQKSQNDFRQVLKFQQAKVKDLEDEVKRLRAWKEAHLAEMQPVDTIETEDTQGPGI